MEKRKKVTRRETIEPSKKNRMTRIHLQNFLEWAGIPYATHLSVNLILSSYKSKHGSGEREKKPQKSVELLMWVFHYRFPEISPACQHGYQCFSHKDHRLNSFAMCSGFSIDHWEVSLKKTNLTFSEAHDCSSVCTSWDMISANVSSCFAPSFWWKRQLTDTANLSNLFVQNHQGPRASELKLKCF